MKLEAVKVGCLCVCLLQNCCAVSGTSVFLGCALELWELNTEPASERDREIEMERVNTTKSTMVGLFCNLVGLMSFGLGTSTRARAPSACGLLGYNFNFRVHIYTRAQA